MVSKGDGATDKAAADNLQHGQSSNSETQDSQQSPKNDIHASERHPEGNIPSVVPEKAVKTPDSVIHPLQSDPEGSSPVIREKVLEDGYNWRKYGQKLVKGNEFIRSYYKCTHPNCLVKKQLERSHDGQITDTVYFGQHDHPRPLSTSVASGFVMSITEERQDKASNIAKEKSMDTHGQASDTRGQTPHPIKPNSSDDVKDAPSESNRTRDGADNDTDPGSKRRKKDNFNVEATPPDKPTGELRVVVHTRSEIDIVNDGYRWRKYGQKLVKGNPHPRSYYRCSSPGCPVKKHVERASHDPKLLITTYEGQHDHDMPPARTVTHNTVGSDAKKTASNRDHSGTTKEASDTASVNMVSHPSSGPESKSSEQLNGNSRVKSGDTGGNTISSPGSSAAGKSNEQQNGRSDATKESDAIGHGEAGAKTKQKGSIGGDLASHVTPHRENNLDEQPQTPTANPIRS